MSHSSLQYGTGGKDVVSLPQKDPRLFFVHHDFMDQEDSASLFAVSSAVYTGLLWNIQ